MDNRKYIYKEIRKISNSTALPLLIYVVLYILFIRFMPQLVTEPLRSVGIGITDRAETFIKYIFIYLLALPIGMLSLWLTRGRKEGINLRQGFRKPEKTIGWTVKWILIAIGASTILGAVPTLIGTVIQGLFDTSASPTDNMFIIQAMSVLTVPKAVASTVPILLFAPIFEECLFRGLIFPNNRKMGELFAIIVSGVFFGLWHQNLPQIFTTAFFGMFSCFLYLRTKSIFPSMIAHFLNNGIVAIRELITSHINTDRFSFNPIGTIIEDWLPILLFLLYSLVVGGAITAGAVLFIIELVRRREFKFDKGGFDISTGKKLLVYFTAPITLIVTLYLVIITVLNTVNGYYWFLK